MYRAERPNSRNWREQPRDFFEQKILSIFRPRFFRPRERICHDFGPLFGHFWTIFHHFWSLGSLFEPCRSSIVVISQKTYFRLLFRRDSSFLAVLYFFIFFIFFDPQSTTNASFFTSVSVFLIFDPRPSFFRLWTSFWSLFGPFWAPFGRPLGEPRTSFWLIFLIWAARGSPGDPSYSPNDPKRPRGVKKSSFWSPK